MGPHPSTGTGTADEIDRRATLVGIGIHVYPTIWAPSEPTADPVAWGSWWIVQHDQIAAEVDKPNCIGEYGWRDQPTRMLVFDAWLQHLYDARGDGSHFWVMQPASSIAATLAVASPS